MTISIPSRRQGEVKATRKHTESTNVVVLDDGQEYAVLKDEQLGTPGIGQRIVLLGVLVNDLFLTSSWQPV